MNAFLPADILLPKTNEMEKWAVIACDQFTSDQAYWDRVRKNAEGAVSTINLILPEAELGTEMEAEHTAVINKTMADYMKSDVFTTYPNSYVYVERTLENGSIREGLVGMSTSTPMTIPQARRPPSAPQSALCRSVSRPASASAATHPSSCRTS